MKNYVLLFLTLTLLACTSSSDGIVQSGPQGEWSIPIGEVRDGGPGKDGIPSVDNPIFISASTPSTFLSDNDLVVGIVQDDVVRAYPYDIMDWHEVVNDEANGKFFALNYCPLTGTAFAWENETSNTRTTFGVSGLLYNANLIMYDRNTDSNWSQLQLECVNGPLINSKPKLYNVVETSWKTWKSMYPETEVLSSQTGFSRTYGISPYGDYATNNNRFIFVPNILNPALPNKQRIYALIDNGSSKVYQFSDFDTGKTIKDTFNNKDYLIVGNDDVMHGFELTGDYKNLDFEYDFNNSEAFFKDNEGNKWSIFGEAIEGPRAGESLSQAKAVMSYWFAIAAFYPNPEIYDTTP